MPAWLTLRLSCSVLLVFEIPVKATDNYFEGHLRFPAVPWCPEKSGRKDHFYDAQRNLCVVLGDRNESIAPHSAPCPPGSGRRTDEFLCRGQIDTAFEIKCQHASGTLPTRPYYANQDYQCIRSLAYVPRPRRCPEGFKLKRLIDRWGTVIGKFGNVCVSVTSRLAEVAPIDPITVESCRFLPLAAPDYASADYDRESFESVSFGPPSQKHVCARVSTSKLVVCPPEAQLRQEEDGLHCIVKIHAPAEFDPVGCKEKFWWSSEFQMCISLKGYIPERTCPWGSFWPWFKRAGVTRRQRNAPRYYGDSANNMRCVADSALPDNPYCPKGYWLENYRFEQSPLCIPETTFEPRYSCAGMEGTELM
eukprot:Gregarina_sp_Poly_1__9522@NODE_599_length_7258_cov_119_643026_g462_i0_p3_GENE_NODE_599_length_7258_cov_119_643026_g462_i0NODE_599_length_7258_cov_119_643026_g462_i0_p3_ORF_typecomplete_len363_score19_54_NODE_599_length_7258_cov_119_643026_g462_i06981786